MRNGSAKERWRGVPVQHRYTCSTRVKHSRSRAVGVPKCMVRVTSVVPSRYWPPESHKYISFLARVPFEQRTTRRALVAGDPRNRDLARPSAYAVMVAQSAGSGR